MISPYINAVSGEEHARVKAQLARVEAVLADLLNERRGTNALQVEMLTWLRNPEAVHGFMNVDPIEYNEGGDRVCRFCDHLEGGHYYEPEMECDLLKLWRILEDERYQKTMDSMFALWCRREEIEEERERDAEINRRRNGIVSVVSNPFLKEGEAFLLASEFGGGLEGIKRKYSSTPQILTSPNDTPRPTGLAAWLPERGILDKDGNDPNAQLFQLPRHIVGVDLGSKEGDVSSVVIAHAEDDKLVVDDIITSK